MMGHGIELWHGRDRKGQVKILDYHDRISVNWVVLFNLDFVPFNLTHVDDTYETPLL